MKSALRRLLSELEERTGDTTSLVEIWRARDDAAWAAEPKIYAVLGERALHHGEPLLAYDIVDAGLQADPDNVRLRQLRGLALARSGASERANRILSGLVEEGHADTETLGMLARTYKDKARHARNATERKRFFQLAAATYGRAFATKNDPWIGINAATTSLLIGKNREARHLAAQVRRICRRALRTRPNDYWLVATLGEVALIEREWNEASDWYARAAELGRRRFGDLQTTRRNARLLMEHWAVEIAAIDCALRVPPIVVFTGHRIDQPERPTTRFPASAESWVANVLAAQIKKLQPSLGYASAACGSDILFLEAMLAAGCEIRVVLPYAREDFARDSVDCDSGDWRRRFDHILARARRVMTASQQRLAIGGVSYDYANQLLLGLASIQAQQWETDLVCLAVWDKGVADGPGGTASAIARWRKLRLPVEIIDLSTFATLRSREVATKKIRRTKASGKKARTEFASQIRAMLFADTVAFSKLKEEELPRFVRIFLGAISRLISSRRRRIIAKNTWGDGLYLVFSNVQAAADFALDLGEFVNRTNWPVKRLPPTLNLRISLHAGPVYECTDPIQHVRNFFGTHVSRAARIEPITPPGNVYASEAFAALAATNQVQGIAFEYAGRVPMPKSGEIYPLYNVTRIRQPRETKRNDTPRFHQPLA